MPDLGDQDMDLMSREVFKKRGVRRQTRKRGISISRLGGLPHSD
jgi:hypothetical protein